MKGVFIDDYKDGQFTGQKIDWGGFGADGEPSKVDKVNFSLKKDHKFDDVFIF